MTNDLDLSTAADGFDIRPGDVDAVVARARTRTRRRRAGLATVTTIAVVAGAVGFIGTRGTGDDGESNVAAGVTAGPVRGEDGLTWRKADAATALGNTNTLAGDGPVYALSTGPGERMIERTRQTGVVWRSDDGVAWTSVSRLGADLFLSDLAPAGGRVYAVGTGPAEARTSSSSLLAGWSDDGGRTWAKTGPLLDMRSLADKTTRATVMDTEVASSDTGTVVLAVLDAALDVPKLLPEGVTAANGWATTDTGVDLLGPRKAEVCPEGTTAEKSGEPGRVAPTEVGPTYCYDERARTGTPVTPQDAHGVVASYTFDQLGVDGDVRRAVRSELVAFFAPPGSTEFERVDVPATSISAPVFALASGAGFDVVGGTRRGFGGEGPSDVLLLHSADGRSWSDARAVSGMAFPTVAGRLGTTPAVIGGEENGAPVAMRPGPDGTWTSTPLVNLVDHPAGTVVYSGPASIGPLGAAIVVTVAPDERDGDGRERETPPTFRLLTSRDGVTWHDRPLDDLAGQTVTGVSLVHVGAERMVITALTARAKGDESQTAPRITLVGTPS